MDNNGVHCHKSLIMANMDIQHRDTQIHIQYYCLHMSILDNLWKHFPQADFTILTIVDNQFYFENKCYYWCSNKRGVQYIHRFPVLIIKQSKECADFIESPDINAKRIFQSSYALCHQLLSLQSLSSTLYIPQYYQNDNQQHQQSWS